MIIDDNKIEKLKIIKINHSSLLVENMVGKKGLIHITEVSNSFIVNLEDIFSVGDIVYGYLIKEQGYKRFYSLKVGHSNERNRKMINETGGGCLGVKYLVKKLEPKNID